MQTDLTPALLTVDEMAEYLRIGKSTAYKLAKQPGFPAVWIKGQIRIPRPRLDRWIESQSVADEGRIKHAAPAA